MDEHIKQILVWRIGIPARQLGGSARLVDDLEMDTLDFVEVALELQRDFDLAVAGDSLARLETVDELVDLVCGRLMITELLDYETDVDDSNFIGLKRQT